MLVVIAVFLFAAAIIVANLTVVAFGPWITPFTSFILIGLDLTLRDWLHVRIRPWQMGTLILATGALTYLLNPAAGMIAIASATAFTVAGIVDWGVFTWLRGSWLRRANGSNVAAAAVDSLLFPTIAFGAFLPLIVVGQFAAKVVGGALWAYCFSKMSKQTPQPAEA